MDRGEKENEVRVGPLTVPTWGGGMKKYEHCGLGEEHFA